MIKDQVCFEGKIFWLIQENVSTTLYSTPVLCWLTMSGIDVHGIVVEVEHS